MMSKWWLSSRRMTVVVEEQGNLVVDAAPIVRKFIGQPLENLTRWMRRQGGYREHKFPFPKEQA